MKYQNLIKAICVLFAVATVAWSFFCVPVIAAGDSFTHAHTDDCMKTDYINCTNHYTTQSEGSSSQYCNTCGGITSNNMYVKWEVCNVTEERAEKSGYKSCKTCGTRTYSWTVGGLVHEVAETSIACGISADSVMAVVSLEQLQKDWTNQPVTLQVNVNIINSLFSLHQKAFSWDNGSTYGTSLSHKVTQNGTYSVGVLDSQGNKAVKQITVANIDTAGPAIQEIIYNKEQYQQGIPVKIVARDDASGLAAEPYSWDGGNTWYSRDTQEITANGTYHIVVRDKLGNQSSRQIAIQHVDNTAPVIREIQTKPQEWYEGKACVTVITEDPKADGSASSGLAEEAYSWDEGATWSESSSQSYNTAGIHTVWVRDAAGNIAEQEFKLEKLQKQVEEEPDTKEQDIKDQDTKENTGSQNTLEEEPVQASKPNKQSDTTDEANIVAEAAEQTIQGKRYNKLTQGVGAEATGKAAEEESAEDGVEESLLKAEIQEEIAPEQAESASPIPAEVIAKEKKPKITGEAVEIVVKTTTVTILGTALVFLFYQGLFIAVIMSENMRGGRSFLGLAFLRQQEDYYVSVISDRILESSETGQYSVHLNPLFRKRHNAQELIVEGKGKKESLEIGREMTFRM